MTQRTQFDRAYTTGVEISAQPEGTPFINFADLKLQIQGPTGAIDLLAIRPFSVHANYAAGDIVAYQGGIYSASNTITAGAWDAGDWTSLIKSPNDAISQGIGWDFTVSYDADGNPDSVTYTSGQLAVSILISYTDGKPTGVGYKVSTDGGSNYTPAGTLTIGYDADDNPTSGTWS